MKKIKLHLAIRSLDVGGAERQFINLVQNIDNNRFDVSVSTMYGGVQDDILKRINNIQFVNLEKKGRYDIFGFLIKYNKILKQINPDIIYTFKEEMNLFSYICKPKTSKIIWGFRASNMDLKQYGKISQLLFWLQKKFVSNIDMIISNSNASIEYHKNNGYDMSKSIVIPNGIDTDKFQRDNIQRELFRKKHNLKENDIAIGIVARIDYMKGYLIFSQIAKNILNKYKNVYFFSVGGGSESIKKECQDILNNHNRFIWLGNKKDVENIYSGLDISSSSSSFGEGFSNSIAEAMSCSLPCVVTDVGDSSLIVDDCGMIVKPDSIECLKNGIEKMIQSDINTLGDKSRKRIVENFSIEKMIINTQKVIKEIYE